MDPNNPPTARTRPHDRKPTLIAGRSSDSPQPTTEGETALTEPNPKGISTTVCDDPWSDYDDDDPCLDLDFGAPFTMHPQVTVNDGFDDIYVDERIAELLQELWRRGYDTQFSCQGSWCGPEYAISDMLPRSRLRDEWPYGGLREPEVYSHIIFYNLDDAVTFLRITTDLLVGEVDVYVLLYDSSLQLVPMDRVDKAPARCTSSTKATCSHYATKSSTPSPSSSRGRTTHDRPPAPPRRRVHPMFERTPCARRAGCLDCQTSWENRRKQSS